MFLKAFLHELPESSGVFELRIWVRALASECTCSLRCSLVTLLSGSVLAKKVVDGD